jgi:hypothetical protein
LQLQNGNRENIHSIILQGLGQLEIQTHKYEVMVEELHKRTILNSSNGLRNSTTFYYTPKAGVPASVALMRGLQLYAFEPRC